MCAPALIEVLVELSLSLISSKRSKYAWIELGKSFCGSSSTRKLQGTDKAGGGELSDKITVAQWRGSC